MREVNGQNRAQISATKSLINSDNQCYWTVPFSNILPSLFSKNWV